MNVRKQDFLTYAVTLYFDDETSEAIRSLTRMLADVTENDFMIQNEVPPHLTLGMFHVNEADVEKLEKLFCDFVDKAHYEFITGNSNEISFSGFESFLNKVIFIKPNISDLLSNLNILLHEIFLPQFEAGDNRNYLPENWYPHIALGVKLSPDQFERGMKCLSSPPAKGSCARIGLACCNPYTPVCELNIGE